MNNKIQDSKKVKKFNILYSKLFIFLAFVLMLSVGVFAFFTFSYDKDVTYEVVGSQGDLLILVELTDQVFNVSQSLTNTQELRLVNQNGVASMFYLIDVNVTNLDPGNCTINGDVTFELEKDAIIIPTNTSFNMSAGLNIFNLTSIALNNRVCPQNITTSLSFTELP
ncbi:hypothetical protein LCGC14_0852440 [marine sediment metagenome]|uniref:Uncharacterized protein n=1 Tax=marine sediment metagenome TaxID=412755 RepID=A0A0F9PEL5_9ZZZZ